MAFNNFRKRIVFYLISLTCLLWFGFSASSKDPTNLTILFTHDLHSNLEPYNFPLDKDKVISAGGLARIFSVVDKERKGKEKDFLLLDAGDFTMGTLFHTIRSEYSAELVTMGLMGYDVVTFGNHEFEFGPDQLNYALSAAETYKQGRLPLITASNTVVDSNNPALKQVSLGFMRYPVKKYVILNRAGLKIGIFGLLGKNAVSCVPEAYPIIFSDCIETAKEVVDTLRKTEAVDMVICLSHLGTWPDKTISEDEILAKEVKGIDLIISGHSHRVLDSYIKIGDTYIVSSGCYGRYLGKIVFNKDYYDKLVVKNYKLTPITDNIAEKNMVFNIVEFFRKKIDKSYLSKFNYSYGQPLALASFSLFDSSWREGKSLINSGLGDLVTDSYKYAVKEIEGKNYENISLSVEAFGHIRVPLAQGIITVNDAFRLLPLGLGILDNLAATPLVTFYLTGEEIKKLAEVETTLAQERIDMRLQFSGMRLTYNPKLEPFSRIIKVEVENPNGSLEFLDDKKLYRICTNWKVLIMKDYLKQLSAGKINFTIKDINGQAITSITNTIVKLSKDSPIELKTWLALAMYLKSFPKDQDGLAQIPDKYRLPADNIKKIE